MRRDRHDPIELAVLDLLASSEDPRRAFAASSLANDARARRVCDRLMETGDALKALYGEQAADEREAESSDARPGPSELRDLVHALASDGRPRQMRRRVFAVAAAALVVVATWVALTTLPRANEGASLGDDRRLGGPQEASPLAPHGAVAEWGTFRWPAAGGAPAWYLLRIEGPDGEVLVEEQCDRNEWTPDPSDPTLRNVTRIEWTVEARDAGSGMPRLEAWSASAWQSPR